MATISQDLRYAIRRITDTPLFTLAAIATLALGLGVTSAVLSLANTIFFKPLRLSEPDRLVIVDGRRPDRPPVYAFGVSHPDYLYFRDHARSFESLAAHYPTSPLHVSRAEGGFEVLGSVVTATYFEVLRLRPSLGRFFTSDEDRVPDRNAVAVLGHDLWRRRFGGDPAILDTIVRINGTDFTVVGIAPERFRGILRENPVDIWIPTAMFRAGYRYCDGLARDCAVVNLVGRLAGEASIEDAQSELTVLAAQLENEYPKTNKGRGVVVRPARGIRANEQTENRSMVAMLGAAAALVMLVASANVAGLLLTRGLRRRKEIAICLALGASRRRVIRQLLVESILLSIAGGAGGLLIAVWATDAGRALLGSAGNADYSLDPRVVAVAFATALAIGLITGVAPALQSTRVGPMVALKEETPGTGSARTRLRDSLIVVQVAVSVLLLGVSGLLVRSFVAVHRGPGFDPGSIVMVRLRPSLIGYGAERSWAFQREAIRRLEATPGVLAASPASVPPLPRWGRGSAVVTLPGGTRDAASFEVSTTYVGPRYFETIGVPLIEGREFDDRDGPRHPPVAIVNETFARRFWPRGGAAGHAVMLDDVRVEIVGVVKNFEYLTSLEQPQPLAYLDFWQQDTADHWSHDSRTHIRVAGDAASMMPAIRRALASVDDDVPVADAASLADRIDVAFSQVKLARAFLVAFGALAMLLSTIGLYASLAFAVAQRTREIAIRIALGAARIDVGRLVFARGASLVAAGIVVGLAAAVMSGPLVAHLLYGVSPRDPLTLAAGPSLLLIVASMAIWWPERRAMAVDPMTALRSE